ncbi:MAG: hypothetical protein IT489_01450, partial [Gammaproteobacteria bacterium]|nr:hypothetical protein [Gammaproteobacteria bacterium]
MRENLTRKLSISHFLGLLVIGLSWICLILASPEEHRAIYYPMMAAILAVVWLIYIINSKDHRIGILDIGLLCAVATLLYTVIPLLNYIAGDFSFTVIGDSRLYDYQPSPYEIGIFHWRHVLYLWSFVLVYSIARGHYSLPENPRTSHVSNAKVIVIIALIILFASYFLFLDITLGISYNLSYEDLMEQRQNGAQKASPLLILQISNYLWGMFFILKLCLLYVILSKYRKPVWRVIFFMWIAAEIGNAIYVMGSRTQLILLLIGAVLLYDHLVRRIRLSTALMMAGALLASFLVFGYFRGLTLSDTQIAGVNVLSASNEFQALLGTAFDVWKRTENGTLVAPWYVHLYDIISLFPPQQIFPFEKQSASQWYLEATDRSGMSGKMWGVISQSIIGYDWLEVILRGAFLGLICGLLHRNFVRNYSGFMTT